MSVDTTHPFRYAEYKPTVEPRRRHIQSDKYCEFNGYSAEYGIRVHPPCQLNHACGCITVGTSVKTLSGEDHWIQATQYCPTFQLQRLRNDREFHLKIVDEIDAILQKNSK